MSVILLGNTFFSVHAASFDPLRSILFIRKLLKALLVVILLLNFTYFKFLLHN